MSETIFQQTHHDKITAQFAAEQDIILNNGGPGYGCTRRAERIAALLRRLDGGAKAGFLTFRPEEAGDLLRYRSYQWHSHTVCANTEENVEGEMFTFIYDPIFDGPQLMSDYAERMFPGQRVVVEPRVL